MEINLGSADRMTRLILGTALLYAALLLPNGWGILLIAVALVALVSGATGLVIVNVPPCTSLTASFLLRARSAKSFTARASPKKLFSSAW